MNPIFLQVTDSLGTTAEKASGAVTESLIDGFIESWYIMLPLLFFSIYSVYVFVERFLTIKKAAKGDKDFMNRVLTEIRNGNVGSAKTMAASAEGPVARILESGLSRLNVGRSMKAIKESVETSSKIEISRLENGISFLATAAGAGPMIGFLGTTIGMISSFNSMRNSTGGIKIAEIAPGMMEAMLTIVAGLVVGILAYIAYNFLTSKIDNVIYQMENSAMDFFDLLDEPGK
jgi:biopolymer transport protein ExbB